MIALCLRVLTVFGLSAFAAAQAAPWTASQPYRAVISLNSAPGSATARPAANRVVKIPIDFAALLQTLGCRQPLEPSTLRVESLDGRGPQRCPLAHRFDHRFSPVDKTYRSAGELTIVVPDAQTTRVAVYFGPTGRNGLLKKSVLVSVGATDHVYMVPGLSSSVFHEFPQYTAGQASSGTLFHRAAKPGSPAVSALVGDGDLLRLAGDGRTTLPAMACYPCVTDFDGDGRWDLVGSDRYGTGAGVTWFRNLGTPTAPLFSEMETFRLQTTDGAAISNPNRGWLLTAALCDWDGDGRSDLLAGGWCRYLTFHKNVGTREHPEFAPGKVIFDAKQFPGLDYGSNPDTPYQGVFIEPCDWDGDGNLDLLCGTYARSHIYFLRSTGRGADGLPVLAAPVALEAGGKPIDFLEHGKPSVADWDGDGDLDLVAGQYYTEATPGRRGVAGCYYFENTGDRRHPKLAAGVQLRNVEGRLISAGFHSQPTMLDSNGDGKMDILVTGGGQARLYLNQGTPRKPRLVETPLACLGLARCAVSNFAYPVARDLDGDGRLDLVVGEGDGHVLFFKGLAGMQYAPPVRIKSQGKEIHEVGCPDGGEAHCGYVKAAIADVNGDGRPDLILWSNNGMQGWQRGHLDPDGWCSKLLLGTADPLDFGPPEEIRAAGQHIRAGYRCKPDVVDLDGDGLPDLIVTCGNGKVNDQCTIMFFKNVGSKTRWELAAPVPLVGSDERPLAVAVRTAVRLVDWDGDGDLDLITGNHSSTSVRYWENVGTKTKPVFAPAQSWKLVNRICSSHHEVGVDAVDLDGDGSLDLLVGNGDSGMIHFFRRDFLDSQRTAKVTVVESRTE